MKNSGMKKNFRKRSIQEVTEEDKDQDVDSQEHDRRLALTLEEIKFLQKQREKKSGIPALPPSSGPNNTTAAAGSLRKPDKGTGAGETEVDKDELVLQDTFAIETAVMEEDPNMLKYVEQELAKKRGKNIDVENQAENEVQRAEDELYKIPEHLRVKRRSSEESSTQWTTGIAEIQLPIEYKLKNIEETEAAKKLLQEKRHVSRAKPDSGIPSSFSADFSQRGKDYAEKHRKDQPERHTDKGADGKGPGSKQPDAAPDNATRRQAATDEIMLDRFRKRERQRVTRR